MASRYPLMVKSNLTFRTYLPNGKRGKDEFLWSVLIYNWHLGQIVVIYVGQTLCIAGQFSLSAKGFGIPEYKEVQARLQAITDGQEPHLSEIPL